MAKEKSATPRVIIAKTISMSVVTICVLIFSYLFSLQETTQNLSILLLVIGIMLIMQLAASHMKKE